MRYYLLPLALFASTSAIAQDVPPALDPGAMTGWTAGEAVRYDLERRACRAKYGNNAPRCAKATESDYERWRNRPGKRDCGAYNWKCPAKPRTDGR